MSERDDNFFVGYLPTPVKQLKFLTLLAAGVASLAVVIALGLAGGQRDPGGARWDLEHKITFEGIVYQRPCPLIRVMGPDNEPRSILLVEQGKFGGGDRIKVFDGQFVRLSGHMLTRGDLKLLELDENPIEPIGERPKKGLQLPPTFDSKSVTLIGEIIDPKCFAGAMRPGDGKTHKACAALCLRGGIPPVFCADQTAYLLVDEDGKSPSSALLEELIGLVGDHVEIAGKAGVWGDLRVLQISAAGIRRL